MIDGFSSSILALITPTTEAWPTYASILSGSVRSEGASTTSMLPRSNQRGERSVSTAQFQDTPWFLVEAGWFPEGGGRRFGISTMGSLGGLRKQRRRFASSRERMQQSFRFEGNSVTVNAFDHSSSCSVIHPFSVKRICDPRLPGGKSLETKPSPLILRISADA